MKKKFSRPLLLIAALGIPCLLQARPQRHLFPFPKSHPAALAKVSAAAKAAAVAQGDLIGFWNDIVVDEADSTDKLYDSLELFLGSNGKYESREHGKEILQDSSYWFEARRVGTWKIESGNYITHDDTCVSFDSELGPDNGCGDDPNDTTATADWSITGSGNTKVLVMADTLIEDTTYLHYISAEAKWTLIMRAPTMARAAHAEAAEANGPRVLLQLGGAPETGLRVLDLRGRTLGRRRGQGFSILPR